MRIQTTLLVLLLAIPAAAQNAFFYPKPEEGRIRVVRDVEFRPGLKLDLYRPAGEAVVPVVIIANIGSLAYNGWEIYKGWGSAIANAGMAGAVYQATQQTARADFDTLLETLRQHATEWGIDPTRVVVWSASANVQFALPLVMERGRDYIRGAVIYYGAMPTPPEIRPDLPVMLVRAGLDSTQLNAAVDKLIIQALNANAPWTIESYGSGLHGFEAQNDNEITRGVIHKTLSFMKFVTRPEMTAAYAAGADDARAGAAFARGDWPVAVDAYRKRTTANPGDAESFRRLGISLTGAKEYAEALTHLEKAWELGRRGPRDTAWPASEAAAGAGNVERTVHWLDILLSTPFGPSVAEVRASDAYAKVRHAPEFVALLRGVEDVQRIALALEGDSAPAAVKELKTSKEPRLQREAVINNLGYRALTKGRHAEAIEIFRLVTQRFPSSANGWDSLSEAYEAAGDRKSAVSAARTALQRIDKDASLAGPARDNIRAAATDRVQRLTKGT